MFCAGFRVTAPELAATSSWLGIVKMYRSFFLILLTFVGTTAWPRAGLTLAAEPGANLIDKTPANAAWHIAADGMTADLLDAKDGTCTLELQKANLKSPDLRLLLETDALTCGISSGSAELGIKLKPDAVTEVRLLASEDSPSLKVDGQESARTRGKWIEICTRQQDPIVRLKLLNVTYATVKFTRGGGDGKDALAGDVKPAAAAPPEVPAGRKSPRATPTRPARKKSRGDAAPAPAACERSLDRAKHSVFQLQTKNAQGELLGRGSGFLYAPGGFAITNYHVVSGAADAVAVFAGEKTEHKVELWAVRRDLDLALVKIKGDAKEIEKRGTLHQATSAVEGEEVWALGFPLGLGYSVTRGVINGIRQSSELPEEYRTEFPAVRSWVQTDCTINPGNSGGPLINGAGELVGINTWVLLKGQNVFFAISAADAESLRDSASQKPVGFAAVKGETSKNWQAFAVKVPRIDIKQTGSASQLKGAVAGLTNGLERKCTGCGGDGMIKVKVTVGRTNAGRPIQQIAPRGCQVCKGRGSIPATPVVVGKIASRFCMAVATINPEDPNSTSALNDAYVALTESMGSSAMTVKALNEQALGQLAQRSLKTNDPLVVVGMYLFGTAAEDKKEQVHYLQMLGSDQIVAVSAPRLADQVMSGPVFVGGLMAGDVTLSNGGRVAVLQGGFIVKATRLRVVRGGEEE